MGTMLLASCSVIYSQNVKINTFFRAYVGYVKVTQVYREECQPREAIRALIGPGESRDHFPSGVSTTAGSRAAQAHRFSAKIIGNNATSARLSTPR